MAGSSSNNASKTLTEYLQDGKPQWLYEFLEKVPYSKLCLLHETSADNPGGFPANKFCVECKTPLCPKCILEFDHGNHAIIQVYRHVYQDAVSVRDIKSFININDIQTYKSNKTLVVALRPLVPISEINKHVGCHQTATKLAIPDSSGSKHGCTKIIISEQVTSSLYKNNDTGDQKKCQVCGKKLVPMHTYFYCSIKCKLTDYMNKSDHTMPPFLMPKIGSREVGCNNEETVEEENYATVEETIRCVDIVENDNTAETMGNENEFKLVEGTEIKVVHALTSRRRKRKGIPHRAPFF